MALLSGGRGGREYGLRKEGEAFGDAIVSVAAASADSNDSSVASNQKSLPFALPEYNALPGQTCGFQSAD
ncbi:MAG: hypothetical protein U0176_15020 [Bacteroidia bacterium]